MATHPDPAARPTPAARLLAYFRIDAARNDRGALSPAVVILAVMIFTLAGLVIDGGRQLGAKSRAVGYAQEAARVGAAAIDLKVSEAKIDTAKAGTAVAQFCAQVTGNDPAVTQCGTTKLTGDDLAVQVTISNKTTFLGMVGIGNLDARGTGEAHAEQGVKKPDESPQIPPIFVITKTEGPGAPTRTATEPPIDLTCPRWTVGSPKPTLPVPLPLPTTCTPNVTPSPTDDPSESPSETPSGTPSPTPSGGGGPVVPVVPQNSVPPMIGQR
ncbi:Flp pilus assembly protein TadG [Kribbella amoyensis]|uniref:Flp pilus assembly protein TadG n=1 Tax=Kribbella amoyensis TaxID=996641 RepID=A0A561BZR5_9ACTN|nr:TadE/TadG family type IV pilus assembly protein [Kribbella amoyensis]TWD84373.1 Flp pilus assembly protein TadG [Kribbella amoyensis]